MHACLDQLDSISQTASRSVSHFCTAHGRESLYLQLAAPFPRHIRDLDPHLMWPTWFLGSTRVHNPNGISIGSAVFAGLMIVTDRQTTLSTLSVTIGRIYTVLRYGTTRAARIRTRYGTQHVRRNSWRRGALRDRATLHSLSPRLRRICRRVCFVFLF